MDRFRNFQLMEYARNAEANNLYIIISSQNKKQAHKRVKLWKSLIECEHTFTSHLQVQHSLHHGDQIGCTSGAMSV